MKLALAGSKILITGGASGIGRQMALQAAARGAHVCIWDLNDGKAVVDEIATLGGSAESHQIDVTNIETVRELAIRQGSVDVLINNAGVVSGQWFLDTDPSAIERTYRVNVLSLYWMTQTFLPAMIQNRKGAVVTIASAAGLIGVAKQTDYSASKFAAVGFMESLRAELRTKGAQVNTLTVCPFYIDTGMFDGVQTRFPLLLPIMKPEYVAKKVLDSIERGKPVLVLPWFARTMPLMRLLPIGVFDAVADFFGVNKTMDHFKGRISK